MRSEIYSKKNYRTYLVRMIIVQFALLFAIMTQSGKDRCTAILFLVPADLLFISSFSRTVMVSFDENCLYLSNLKSETAVPFEKVIKIKHGLYFNQLDWTGGFFTTFRLYYLDKEDKKRSAIFYIRRDNDKKHAWKDLQTRLRLKFPETQVDDP